MNAKECDRCGTYYYGAANKNVELPEQLNKGDRRCSKFDGIGISVMDEEIGKYFRCVNLCPYCTTKFIKWFEEVE